MSDEENEPVAMAECGACRAVIPIDSAECPECGTSFSGVSEDELGECGACNALVPLDSTRCPECGVLFVADDVVDILRQWIADTGINIRKLFEKFDENNDGTIDSEELKTGLLSLNLADLPPSQVERLVAEIDADGNGVIDLDEFDQILMGEAAEPEISEDDVEESTAEAESEGTDDAAEEADDETDISEPEESPEEIDEEVQDETLDVESIVVHTIDDEEFDLEDDDTDEEASSEDHELDEEAVEHEEDESAEEGHRPLAALSTLADLMDEHDISAQRLFNELDADGNKLISLSELKTMLEEKYGDVLEIDEVNTIMEGIDVDGDGMIDVTEFIGSMEDYEVMEELVEEKIFPSPWQKRMMSKSWNDTVWPILHVGFGILIAIFIANGMFGFVDGSGGNIAYEPNDSGLIPSGNIQAGDIYPCDEKFQKDGCRNSLTPFAGENGSLSMPTNFYWDGILLIAISVIGLGTTLFFHLIKAPEWRARAKAMKEFEEDKSAAIEDADDDNEDDSEETTDDGDHDDDDDDDDDDNEDDEIEDPDEEDDDDDDDDAIDIGSHIGLVFDDEEVYGKIIEFDDDEGTVTIEEDGTGDLVTGYQEDMFIE